MLARYLGLILLLAGSGSFSVPAHSPWPGGVAVLRLYGDQPPVVTVDGQAVLTMRDRQGWNALIGIPLEQEAPGAIRATVAVPGLDTYDVVIDLVSNSYPEQRLNVDRKYVEPSKAQLDRILAERQIIDAALNLSTTRQLREVAMNVPVAGRRSSSFGLRRFFNGQPRSPHKGMDIAAVAGTPILAPLAGTIATTGDFYFNGNTVIVDHGQGFISLYCHLSKTDAEKGQVVAAGDVLGEVGATGRVTGAHLHFATYLNGTAVDPALFLQPE